ncbi:MAG: amino acid ABC transporter substrate-binding protein [Selenomonadaceae bacterium]|nr:amino acid ABC transporter substrate-binding protein [Selenomonadaceae bacterium]
MKRFFYYSLRIAHYAFLIAVCALLFGGCGDFKGQQKIIVGLDDDFPPMGFRNERGELVGFDVDLAKEVGRRMGVNMVFQPINWDNKREEILSGHIDIIWNGLDITEERKSYMIFSKSYMDDRQIVLAKRDCTLPVYSEHDLAGKIIGTQAGSTSDCYLKRNFKDVLGEHKTYDRFKDAIVALMNDEIELIVCDELIARYEMNTHPDQLKIIDIKIGVITETGIGFRKEDTELRDRIQATFDEMIKDGTAKKISEQWFGADLIRSKRR